MPDNVIDKQLYALETRLSRKPSVATAVAVALRGWLAFRLELGGDPRAHLHNANHAAAAALRKNETEIKLLALSIFISIEGDRFDAANEMLDTAFGYKSFLKNNEPFYYALMCYLYAYLEIKQKRARSAKKHMHALEEFIKTTNGSPRYDLMLGLLYLDFYEYEDAYHYLAASYDNGCRSIFLFYGLYRYYRTALRTSRGAETEPLDAGRALLPTLTWAAAHSADANDILNVYSQELYAAVTRDPAAGERIYARYADTVILQALCTSRMLAKDYSPEAYSYYRDAEQKQLTVSGLYPFLVRAAYLNGVERVNRYAMAEYLRTGEMDNDLKIFVYHLLLTDSALVELLPAYKNEILQFCTYCLENNISGRMVNSLYYYFWTECRILKAKNEHVDRAETFLFEDICRFEVTAPAAVRFIYITEREKKGMAVYELPASDEAVPQSVTVAAVDENFSLTCLSAGRRNILNGPVKVRRSVSRAEPALYRYFFRKGSRDFSLLAYLANYYLARINEPGGAADAIPVFEAILEHKDISKSYKMRVHVALGGLYYRAGRFDKALDFYGAVDENLLEDSYVEQILGVFLQTHEWARAAGLIMRKSRCVSDKALFNAIKQLSVSAHARHHPALADAAYELLVNSWYDQDLLSLALAHYNGGQSEWQALSRALSALNITEPRLDEIILKNSMWMHQFDEDAEKTFARMAANYENLSHPLLKQFMEYCAYEMLVNDVRPNYETLTLLEKACISQPEKSADPLLAYALCHVYLRHSLTTFHSERVLADALALQERDGLLFSVFRDYREKRPPVAYIEKNQPFIYRSLPEKNVWLYYKIDDEAVFHAQPMRYIRFGLYLTVVPLFYHERITYYFSEEMPTGSITTRERTVSNETVYLDEQHEDSFFIINNAIIYEQLFKYEHVEKIITTLVKDVKQVRSGLM